jgi:hypothetical protein
MLSILSISIFRIGPTGGTRVQFARVEERILVVHRDSEWRCMYYNIESCARQVANWRTPVRKLWVPQNGADTIFTGVVAIPELRDEDLQS